MLKTDKNRPKSHVPECDTFNSALLWLSMPLEQRYRNAIVRWDGKPPYRTEQSSARFWTKRDANPKQARARKELGLKTSLPNVTQTNSVYTVIRWMEKFEEFQETGRVEHVNVKRSAIIDVKSVTF